MSGKSKQRTKGNAKPSSSGRAAALISKDGTVGFVGFGGLMGSSGGSNLGYVPMATGSSEDFDASVDAEFRMVMRKLMKRDAVTKLKAIQEFADLCKNSAADAVESALPFWPRNFNKLALDVDHRVREATQQAMEQLVLRVGRNLAPHLRYIIGPWLCSQFDTYPTVASSGRKSFLAAFSEEKQADVILFCRKELFEFLQDNILTQTPSTLSDPKFVEEEDREAKFYRVLSASILTLGKLISVTSEKAKEDMQELYLNLLREKKFWKCARHKSPHVRGAVFSTVSISCEKIPLTMSSISCLVSPAVLSAMDDSDPAVCPQAWDAVLSVVKNIVDCWKQVNLRKAVLPKLWSVLKNGGSGCASIIFPNLLPFLSKIPAEVIGSGLGFYQEFFNNLQEGLAKEHVQNSPSECSAVVSAFMECLRFCLVHRFDLEGSHDTVQEYLIKEQLLSVMETSLQKQSVKILQSNLYVLVADLLSFLSMKSPNDSVALDERASEQFNKMLNWFWEGLSCLCLEHVKSINEKIDLEYLSSVSLCLITLKNPTVKSKKIHKVAFAELSPEHSDSSLLNTGNGQHLSVTEASQQPGYVEKLYNGRLLKLLCDVCRLCLEEFTQANSFAHQILLSKLVPEFASVQLVRILNNTSGNPSSSITDDSNDYCALSEQFVKHTLFCWMKLPCKTLASTSNDQSMTDLKSVFSDVRSVEHVLNIFCGIIKPLPVDKQEDLVSQAVQQNSSVIFLYELVHQGLQSNVSGVVRWLESTEGTEKLMNLSKSLVVVVGQETRNSSPALPEDNRLTVWKLLKLCLVTSRRALRLPTAFLEEIFHHFLRILTQSELEGGRELLLLLDILHSFLNDCETNVSHVADLVPCTMDILVTVFKLELCDKPHVSERVSELLAETWQVGLKVFRHSLSEVDQTPSQTLLLKAAEVIHDKLSEIDTLDRVENLVVKAVSLLKDASNGDVEGQDNITRKVFNILSPNEKELSFLRNEFYSMGQWLLPPVLDRNLPVMSTVNDDLEFPNTLFSLANHQKIVVFTLSLAQKLLTTCHESPGSIGDIVTKDCLVGLWLEMCWLKRWCSCVLGNCDMKEKFGAFISDHVTYNLLLNLRSTSTHLLDHIKRKDWCQDLLTEALSRSRTEGFMWCLVLEGVLADLQQLGISYDPALLIAEVQSFAALEDKECQTLTTLLPWVDGIYELKIITEQFTGLIRDEKDESGYSRAFAVISSSLQQWFKQTNSTEALLEYQLTLTGIVDELIQWNKANDRHLLINSLLDETASMSVLTLNLSVMRILEMAVLHCPCKMNNQQWDFILCSLAGWFQTCDENRSHLTTSLKCVALCCQACSLFCTVVKFFQKNTSKLHELSVQGQLSDDSHEVESAISESPAGFTGNVTECPQNLFDEWEEFFSWTLYSAVLKLFLFHADESQRARFEATLWSNRISESLGLAVVFTPLALLKKHEFEGTSSERMDQGSSKESQWLDDLMAHCLPLLKCNAHALQFAAYHLLSKVMTEISLFNVMDTVSEESEDEIVRSPPTPLLEMINLTCSRMTEMVIEAQVPFGEHLEMASDIEAQNTSLALMLAWKLLLKFFRGLPQEKRVEYAKYIKKNKMVDDLLQVLFRLLPFEKAGVVVADDCELEIGGFTGQRTIQELARNVSYSLLQWMPAIVRQWWNGLDKRRASIVDKFTTSCITPRLCQREMEMVQNSPVRFDNMLVKTRPSAREVAALYTVEDMSIELVVKLASNHPLGVVSVESGKKIGIATAQWRSWILQMTTFLTHQNGSIMDGLILWKRNVDKRFEGVDDCMICFSVIHGSNYSLPKLSCKTCKKKFHSACLYKWFSTSNNATCPLCRNLF